ncbi:flavin monoamine oxidase family protein [Kitasatospora sp. NPDC058965]|uniref:flavin monoamine oxidase family protein n=1 Tax=Kitasatospora sp. NPDC058965 TaxID=3346682 RepID=UPI0036D0F1C9
MARSHPLWQLKQVFADQAAADRLRLPLDEYRGLRDDARAEPAGLSRRALFARAAALGIGLTAVGAAPRARAAAATGARYSGPAPRIAIVGAGIAGLNAALALADKGIAATVYEANPDRIGGRMYSGGSPSTPGLWAQGQVSEYGGELVDTAHKTVQHLCQRFGLGLTDVLQATPAGAEQILRFNGGYYPRAQADLDFKQIWQAVQADARSTSSSPMWNSHTAADVAMDNLSVRDWIDTRVPGGHRSNLGAFLDVAYAVEYGADTTQQSAFCLLELLSAQANPGSFAIWGGSNERYHITGGNDQLPHAVAAALPAGTVQQGWSLRAVVRNADGSQTLTFAVDGGGTRTVTADHTILAVPLPVLQQDVDLSGAGLDTMMRGVLTRMTMGACTKLNMQFTGRPWTGTGPWPGTSGGECFSDLPFQQAWDVTRGQGGSDGILIQYGGGTPARSLTPPSAFTDATTPYTADLARSYLGQIDQLWPGTGAVWNGRATLSAWHLNPYSHGAYSYWPVGYVTGYAGYEATAQGRLHFAGEHTSYDFQGYMEGGAETGARAAQEVLTAIGA